MTILNVTIACGPDCELTVPHLPKAGPKMLAEPSQSCTSHLGHARPASSSNFFLVVHRKQMQKRRSSYDPGIGIYYLLALRLQAAVLRRPALTHFGGF